tara:strand:+ start:827 stop:973 length:147 start_codon:yes stop_codon:yes gene_type:complete
MQLNTTKNLKLNKQYFKILDKIKTTEEKLKELKEKKRVQAVKLYEQKT